MFRMKRIKNMSTKPKSILLVPVRLRVAHYYGYLVHGRWSSTCFLLDMVNSLEQIHFTHSGSLRKLQVSQCLKPKIFSFAF